jgi:endonuclease YncB( thermonuclease family)
MKRLGLLAFAIAVHLSANAAHADLIGFAEKIYDGDTFALCDQTVCNKIRICGIDAPEIGDKGSSQATAALAGLISGRTVQCIQVGKGTVCDGRSRPINRDRIVAQCFAGTKDIARELVGEVLRWGLWRCFLSVETEAQ